MKFIKVKCLGNTIIIFLSVLMFIINIIMGGGNRFWIFLTGGGNLLDYGQAQYDLVFVDLQLWRLISSGYLHMGILHLFFNVYALCFLGNIAEKRLGTIKYLLVYHLLMIITEAIQCTLFKETTMAGASSGIFAVIGILFVENISCENKIWNEMPKGKRNYVLGYLIIGNLISLYTTALHAISFLLGTIYGLAKKEYMKRVRNG